jgi:hypothetical protein
LALVIDGAPPVTAPTVSVRLCVAVPALLDAVKVSG